VLTIAAYLDPRPSLNPDGDDLDGEYAIFGLLFMGSFGRYYRYLSSPLRANSTRLRDGFIDLSPVLPNFSTSAVMMCFLGPIVTGIKRPD
jgi:hypothetical protein